MAQRNDNHNKTKVERKIEFLQDQLISLEYGLAETRHFLIQELDSQRKILTEIELKEEYERIDCDHMESDS